MSLIAEVFQVQKDLVGHSNVLLIGRFECSWCQNIKFIIVTALQQSCNSPYFSGILVCSGIWLLSCVFLYTECHSFKTLRFFHCHKTMCLHRFTFMLMTGNNFILYFSTVDSHIVKLIINWQENLLLNVWFVDFNTLYGLYMSLLIVYRESKLTIMCWQLDSLEQCYAMFAWILSRLICCLDIAPSAFVWPWTLFRLFSKLILKT